MSGIWLGNVTSKCLYNIKDGLRYKRGHSPT